MAIQLTIDYQYLRQNGHVSAVSLRKQGICRDNARVVRPDRWVMVKIGEGIDYETLLQLVEQLSAEQQ